MQPALFKTNAENHFDAAEKFATFRGREISWWTYAGYPPKSEDDPLPFGIEGQDAEYVTFKKDDVYVVCLNTGEYK